MHFTVYLQLKLRAWWQILEVDRVINALSVDIIQSIQPMSRIISMPSILYPRAITVHTVQRFLRTNMPWKTICQKFTNLMYDVYCQNRKWQLVSLSLHCFFCSANWGHDDSSCWRCWLSVPWVWISIQSFKQCQAPHWRQAHCVHWLQLPTMFRSSEKQSCPE